MSNVLSSKETIHEAVTRKMVALIEEGAGSFKAPWHVPTGFCGFPTNALTHAEYKGINILSLWIAAQLQSLPNAMWATYRQWQQLGAQVRKGERGSLIVFYKRLEAGPAEDDDPDRRLHVRFVARASFVFNAAQVDGYTPPQAGAVPQFQLFGEVEAFVGAVNAKVQHGFSSARYRSDIDTIEMPERDWFAPSGERSMEESYYAVLLHELTHWTGAPHRLCRSFGKRFGDEAYAFEELVAEIGAAFLCAAFGFSTEPRPDHAAYVGSWLKVLGRDPRAIFHAASLAQEAFEHLSYLATRPDLSPPI